MGDSGGIRSHSRAIIDSLDDELLVVGQDYRIIEANNAVLARHGKSREEVIGQYCYRISHGLSKPCRHPRHECPIKRVKETCKPMRVTHIHVYDTLGKRQERYVDIIASPITDKQGDIIAFTEVMRDVTEARRAELEVAKLHQEVANKEKIHSELLHQLFSIQEEERRRIARELHDETSQVLASLTASLEVAIGILSADVGKAKALLVKAQALSISVLDGIHKLIYELRPTLLDDLGLVAAMRWLVDNSLGATGVAIDFNTTGRERRLPFQVETTLFRVVQEAVHNVVKHADARNVNVSLNFRKSGIRVRVRDDGKGFDVREALSSKDRPRGLGLLGMKERVELINGRLTIRSRPGGNGTGIDIEIPLPQSSI